jgi:succinyl-diaminopimelate desuccinylase
MHTTDAQVLALTRELVERPSVTPGDEGCQTLLAARLERCGFTIEWHPFGEVRNLWARRGERGPLFVFAGHTDVVPTGDPGAWRSPPFEAVVREGRLYGRGSADMKSALAAMVVAVERFVATHPEHAGSIALLITSDEEGDAIDGTARVVELLRRRGERIDYCIVGEPSSQHRFGDTIRIGRRGSLNGVARIRGVQGHVAYPERAKNPVHAALAALAELATRRWDDGNEHFPPTGFQISNIHAGTGATNVIPGELVVTFNFRFNTAQTADGLRVAVQSIFERHQVDVDIAWTLSGLPFLTSRGRLVAAVEASIGEVTGRRPEHSTGGGTSDGRFIAPTGAEVVECGVVGESIHKVDEHVELTDLKPLADVYEGVLTRLLATPKG